VAVLAVCVAIACLAFPAYADSGPDDLPPVGNSIPLAADDDLDEIFDDAFELELDRTSDMQRLDPFEDTNRKMFAFNERVIDYVLDPIMVGYRFAVPSPARRGLRLAFQNLDAPRILVNDLLQLRFRDAGETLGRFVLNTAFGFGGIFDVGEAAGWVRHDADFGQTLGKMGVASGPYLMVPVFGPTTVRDGFGSIIDLAFQPLAYILGPAEIMLQLYIGSGNGLIAIDANHDKLEALEESSIDYYAALRSAYLQNRRAAVASARGEPDIQPQPEADSEPAPVLAERQGEVQTPQVRADASTH
jgi:phospholipid-binding lipoprotein MlaA